MKTLFAILVLVLGGFAFGLAQQKQIVQLRENNRGLKETAEQAAKLQVGMESLPARPVDTNELARLRREHEELMKWRGEVGLLRQSPNISAEDLEKRVASAQSEVEEEHKKAEWVEASYKAKELAKVTRNYLSGCIRTLQACARKNQGTWPQSLDEIRQFADSLLENNNLRRALNYSLAEAKEGVSWQTFEFIPQAQPIGADSRAFILRERQPRQMPDGTFVRAYGRANREVEEIVESSQ